MRLRSWAVTAALAAPPAALWTVALWGRTSVAGLSGRWLATLVCLALAVALWARLAGGRAASGRHWLVPRYGLLPATGLLPAASFSAVLLGALHFSDAVHHRFVFEPLLKGVSLPLCMLLVLAAPGIAGAAGAWGRAPAGGRLPAAAAALQDTLPGRATLVGGVTLGAAGLLQAVSLINVATDDLIRYWSIADAMLSGAGYPVTEGSPRAGGFYLIDQPLYPFLLLPSFRLLGHRYLALHLPLIMANVALPFVFYGLARAAMANTPEGTEAGRAASPASVPSGAPPGAPQPTARGASPRRGATERDARERVAGLWLALVVLCFPYYQVYALGAADPEPLWAVEAGLLLLMAMRLTLKSPGAGGRAHVPRDGCEVSPAAPQGSPSNAPTLAWGVTPRHRRRPHGRWDLEPGMWDRGTRRRLLEWAALGLAGAAAGLTRPEGTLYAGVTMLGLAWWYRVALWRGVRVLLDRRAPPADAAGYLLAGALCAVPIGLFTLFLWHEFGVLSAAGWLEIAGLRYLLPNLGIVVGQDVPYYAEAIGLPLPAQSGPILALGLLGIVLTALWRQWQRQPALRFVPVALTLNLMVILLTPTDFAGDVLSPQTFLRHLSVLFPWLVGPLALVVPSPRGITALAMGALLLAELSVLGSVTGRTLAGAPTILTSDPYVLATDLWQAPDALPRLPFSRDAHGTLTIDPGFDYLGFRRGLFSAVRPYDQHVNDAGRAHILATGVVALAGLGTAAGYASTNARKAAPAAATV